MNDCIIKKQLSILKRGVVEIIQEPVLIERLRTGKPLRVKAGFDPTAPDLHLGHTVLLNKLRDFQKLGHHIIFLIGDFTAQIGDPTGKNVTRQPLSKQDVEANARTYESQLYKILDPDKTEVVFNSSWMSQLSAADIIKLAGQQTVARMLERDDFSQRFHSHQSIAIHEFLYPLLQGYDSVELRADIELGGSDQKFNLLMGRELQKNHQQPQQVVMLMPLMEGLDGHKKMSKSLDNYVGIDEQPKSMFGKLMSVSDELMWRYLELLSFASLEQIDRWQQEVMGGRNPKEIKLLLAEELVTRFHGEEQGAAAREAFEQQFSRKGVPADVPSVELSAELSLPLPQALKLAALVSSTSEALRLISQGAVRLNEDKQSDPKHELMVGHTYLVQVGKRRWARLHVCSRKDLHEN